MQTWKVDFARKGVEKFNVLGNFCVDIAFIKQTLNMDWIVEGLLIEYGNESAIYLMIFKVKWKRLCG